MVEAWLAVLWEKHAELNTSKPLIHGQSNNDTLSPTRRPSHTAHASRARPFPHRKVPIDPLLSPLIAYIESMSPSTFCVASCPLCLRLSLHRRPARWTDGLIELSVLGAVTSVLNSPSGDPFQGRGDLAYSRASHHALRSLAPARLVRIFTTEGEAVTPRGRALRCWLLEPRGMCLTCEGSLINSAETTSFFKSASTRRMTSG